MVDKIIIDEKGSVNSFSAAGEGWAKEATLSNLYKLTAGSNVYLNKLSKNTLSEKEFEKAQQEVIKVSKTTGKISESGFRGWGTGLNKNFKSLEGNLFSSFKGLSTSISSISSGGIVGMIGNFASDASIGLKAIASEAGPLTAGLAVAASEIGFAIAAYVEAYEIVEKLSDAYQEMYDNGINFSDGLAGMTQAAGDVGLSTQDLVKSFNQFSGVVTYLGTNKATKLAKQFTELNRVSGDLGLTNQEATDAVLNYTDMLRVTGSLSGKTNNELVKGTQNYLSELNQVASITGKNRKDLQKEAKDRAKDLDLNLSISNLAPDVQQHIRDAMVHVSAFGDSAGDVTKILAGLFSDTGIASLPQELQLTLGRISGLNDAFGVYKETLKNGTNEQIEAAQANIARIMQGPDAEKAIKGLRQLANNGGSAGIWAKKMVELYQNSGNLIAHENKIREAYNKARQNIANKDLSNESLMAKVRDEDAAGINDSNRDMIQAHNALSNAGEKIADAFNTLVTKVIVPTTPLLLKLADGFIFTLDSVTKAIEIYSLGFKTLGTWIGKLSDSFEAVYNDSWLQKTVDILITPITFLTGLFTKLGDGLDNLLKLFGYEPNPGEKSGDTGDHDRNRESSGGHFKWFNLSNFTTGVVITGMAIIIGKVLAKLGLGTLNVIKTLATAPSSLAKGLTRPFIAGGKGLWNVGKKILGLGASEVGDAMDPLKSPLFNGKEVGGAAAKGMGGAAKVAEGVEKAEESITGLTNKLDGVKPSKFKFLTDLSQGIASFGTLGVTKGIANILLMGAGIAGVLYLTAKAAKQFTDVSWEDMAKAGATLVGLGGALTIVANLAAKFAVPLNAAGEALGAFGLGLAPIVLDIDGLALAVGGVALAIGEALKLATPALNAFGDIISKVFSGVSLVVSSVGKAITDVIDSFTKMKTAAISATTDEIERLSKIPSSNMMQAAQGVKALKDALDGFQPGFFKGISNFFGALLSNDPVKQLQKLSDLGPNLNLTATSLGSISKSYADAMAALNGAKIDDSVNKTIDNLGNILFVDNKAGFWSGKVTTASKVQELADSIGSLAAKTAELQSAQSGATATTGAKLLSPSDLQKRTLSFYDDQKTSNVALIQLLQMVNGKLDILDQTTEDSSDKLADAIKKASGHLF